MLKSPVALPAPAAGPDPSLVARAQAGDAGAFRALFVAHAPAVRRFLHELLRDAAAADEATQETFVRAHARLPSLRDTAQVRTWLLGIARLVHLEMRRAQRRDGILPEPGDEEDARVAAVLPTPSPEDLLLDAELLRHLDAGLAQLSEGRRAALTLRVEQGMAYEDIAEVLGWTVSQVRNALHRGRMQLRSHLMAQLGPFGADEEDAS